MPNSQTLQLYFDLTQTQGSQDGLFADDTTAHHSKVWMSGANPPVQWPDSLLTVNYGDQVAIGVTIAINLPSYFTFVDSQWGDCLRITAVFGRNHHPTSSAIFDSPFAIKDVTPLGVCTVFDQSYPAAIVTSNGGTITLGFGAPQFESAVKGGTDKYGFIVAITLYVSDSRYDPSTLRTFTAGHDPDMNVNC
jgi:hypothetical protein